MAFQNPTERRETLIAPSCHLITRRACAASGPLGTERLQLHTAFLHTYPTPGLPWRVFCVLLHSFLDIFVHFEVMKVKPPCPEFFLCLHKQFVALPPTHNSHICLGSAFEISMTPLGVLAKTTNAYANLT